MELQRKVTEEHRTGSFQVAQTGLDTDPPTSASGCYDYRACRNIQQSLQAGLEHQCSANLTRSGPM